MSTILRLDEVTQKFGELLALDALSLEVATGEILGIMGPNGSGKTTLLNLASGLHPPTSGRLYFRDQDISQRDPHHIVDLGLTRTFQTPRLFGSLDCVGNTIAALRRARKSGTGHFASLSVRWADWREDAQALLATVFGDKIPWGPAASLAYGERRLLELVRALGGDPALILLDEPTSGLNDDEADRLSDVLGRIARERRLTMVIVDHKFAFLRTLCSRMVILNQGRVLADAAPPAIAADAGVNEIYFGGAMT